MGQTLPRIATVQAERGTQLRVTWARAAEGAGSPVVIELGGWIAGGGELLAPLRDPSVFGQATVGEYGAFVTWDEDTGDLCIDAWHLELLRREQATNEAA